MVGKDKPKFYASHHGNAITFLLIGIIITTSISFAFPLVLNQNHTAMAQQQQLQQQPQQLQANNQTFSPSVEEQQQLLEGISFQTRRIPATISCSSQSRAEFVFNELPLGSNIFYSDMNDVMKNNRRLQVSVDGFIEGRRRKWIGL